MKPFNKSVLLILMFAITIASCEKIHLDDIIDHHDNIVSRKGLPMSGDQEVPQKITPATGTLDVSYNKKTNILKFTITWADLTGDPIGSHIHGTAPVGVNAPIRYDFTDALPKTVSGTFADSVEADGVAIKEDSLLNGFYYINIHTPLNPGGEIRGQIVFK
jgi:CHRD domain